ncbi:MAG: DUF2089 family protein [Dehalococcoidia bacterium]
MKTRDWQDLVRLTQGSAFTVERVRMPENDIVIEGAFELPALARLSAEDQVFVMAFVRAEGVIKEMERVFGVSYPTIKGRLARIVSQLQFVETIVPTQKQDILDELDRGELTAQQAIERLSK